MLTRNATLLSLVGAFVLSGCVITSGDSNEGGGGSTANNNTGGSNNTGGETTTDGGGGSGTTNATTGGGGEGGGEPTCTDPAGTGKSVSECEDTNVSSINQCPGNNAPPIADSSCTKGYEIYTQGSWEVLLGCISEIPATIQDACDDPEATDHVVACLTDMYNAACLNPDLKPQCDDIATQCEGFDATACAADLNPFSQDGLNAYSACLSSPEHENDACADLHNNCFTEVTSF
jgi:hypothetical protein